MILLFPNLDTFRLVLTGGLVPPEMALAPAVVSHDDTGRIFVETAAKLPKKSKDTLEQLKVLGSRRHATRTPESVVSWLQILPLVIDPHPPQLSTQAPVLFELRPEQLPTLVGEMLRLGNDRQSFRLVQQGEQSRALLRVLGPPYYTLLRAIDKLAVDGETVRAYTEQAPRVWVEIGTSHPLAQQVKLEPGQMVLIHQPRTWTFLPEESFQDVYDILNLTLPHTASPWIEAQPPERVTIPLRLVPGNASEPAEMWIIRGDGLTQLDAMVRDADDRLTAQLRFAVGTTATGEQSVVLSVAPSKKSLPVLALDNAMAFRSYWRIPNLFLPVGTRLHPTIRRDVITKLLADNRDQRVWLYPTGDGGFVPETIAENAFRSLSDWVEYVIDAHTTPLREWIESTEFEFESFICTDTGPKPRPDGEKPEREKPEPADKQKPTTEKPIAAKTSKKATPAPSAVTPLTSVAVARPPSEWKIRCDQLEREFRDLEGPLDMPERQALWPQLAEANSALGDERRNEAAICWVNSLWEQSSPAIELVQNWAESETPNPIRTGEELDARMAVKNPTPSQVRATLSLFLALASETPRPAFLSSRLPALQNYLDEHESKLPIRAAWLVATRLSQLAGGDVLGLARVRDRLLNRLLERGLSIEQDLPAFLRYAGLKNSERVRIVREQVVEIHRTARTWAEKSLKPAGIGQTQQDATCTLAYLDLMFAFGLAKLGEISAARLLTENAHRTLTQPQATETKTIVAQFLLKVFQYRIEDALAGKPNTGLLSRELLDELDAIGKRGTTANDPHKLAHYVINRMREQSEIVEPQEKNDPYAEWMKHGDELKKELAELPKLKDVNVLGKRILDLFKHGIKGNANNDTRFTVLHDSLHLTPRVGQEFAIDLVKHVPTIFEEMTAGTGGNEQAKKQGKLLERALFLAAHYDKTDLVQTLVDRFIAYVHTKPDEQRFELVNIVAGRCLTSLRKVGLREEIDKLLRRMQDEVLKGKALPQLKVLYATKPDLWAEALQTMLNLAAGWLTFGLVDQALPILETAREEILGSTTRFSVQKFTNLCRTYVGALGQGPADLGMPRLVELFQKLDPARITITFTTAPYYSRLHLNLIESVVLAVVSDDFALGQSGKRWLDEDEHLVRRRIHRDMRAMVAKGLGSG